MSYQINPNFPTLEKIMNLVRAICNDSFAGATNTPGEGQVLTDNVPGTTTNNPWVLNLLNSAIRDLYRKLRIIATPSLIEDNYILFNVPVLNTPAGPGVPDPSVQTYLDNIGYWDGMEYWNNLKLPTDMLAPLRLWERTTGTTDTFIPMNEMEDSLPPGTQVDRLVNWEWRKGRLNFNGATTPRDVRIRYQALLPQFFAPNQNFATLYIPVLDCEDYVAYHMAAQVTLSLGNPQVAQMIDVKLQDVLGDIRNERVRRMQRVNYRRRAYNDSDTAQELDVYGI